MEYHVNLLAQYRYRVSTYKSPPNIFNVTYADSEHSMNVYSEWASPGETEVYVTRQQIINIIIISDLHTECHVQPQQQVES